MAHVRRLQDLTFVHAELPGPRTVCCVARKAVICVRAGGQVTACPYVPHVLGSVHEERLADIWDRHAATLRVKTPGLCPMNVPIAREALRAHAESVRNAGRLSSGSRMQGTAE